MIVRRASFGALFLAAACGGPAEPAETPRPRPPRSTSDSGAKVPALASALLAKVPAGTFGPYLGRGETHTLVVWAAQTGASRKWFATALAESGAPTGAAKALADAPAEVGLVAVEPAGKSDFVIVSTHADARGHHVAAMLVSGRGERLSGPATLDSGADPVRWVDAVPTATGALVFWARQKGAAAEIFALALEGSGPRGEPKKISDGARAWQIVPAAGGGAAVAVTGGDSIRVLAIDAALRPRAETVIADAKSAELDLDAVRVGDRILVGWSDRRDLDARIQLALVDASGKLVVPARAAIDTLDGDQALVRLVPPLGGGPAYVVWESLPAARESERSFAVASVTSEGKVGGERGEIRVSASDDTVPEIVASSRGVAALTLSRACPKSATAAACASAERLPAFVELDRGFRPVAAEPMRLDALGGNPAELAWGLACRDSGCVALAAVASDPAPVFAVKLAARSNGWQAAGGPQEREPPPRPRAVTTLAAGDPLADVAVTRSGTTTLVAWVSYFDPTTPWKRLTKPAPDGRFDPLQALLQVRALPDGKEPSAAETISLRARSLGGVAIAPGAPEHQEAMLVWTAVDAGQPQLFATILGADGKKARQKMLTRSPGEKSDVAVAFAGDGWLVGWVDERHGDPELYAAKFNRYFQRVGPERRLTNARGVATGVAMAAAGTRVVVVWSDARQSDQPGSADPHALLLEARDGSPIGSEVVLATTRPHSFCPAVARVGDELVVAWLEGDGGGIRIGRLDSAAKLPAPATIAVAGSPTALALACSEGCRVVAAVDRGEQGELVTAEWSAQAGPGAVRRVSRLPGPAGQAASPALIGDEVIFADQVREQGRVRRMLVEWR